MSDYSRQQDFNAKTGTTIFGSDVDDEFDALVTAVNSKTDESREGSASGVATLDGSALIPVGTSGLPTTGGGQVPEASVTTLGAVELANTAEAQALTDALRVLTPDALDDVLVDNGGMAKDIQQLADPGFDTLLGWDETTNEVIGFTLGTGIEFSGTTVKLPNSVAGTGLAEASGVISMSHLGIEALADAGFDALMAWDDSETAVKWFTAADGVSFFGTTFGLTDVVAGAAQPVDIASGVFTFDLTSITEITAPLLDQAADGFLVSDAGVLKVLPIDQSGVIVVNATDAIQTFALADANTMQILDGTTDRIWTIPANASVAFEIGTVILIQSINTAVIEVLADTGVTLMSRFNTGGTTATSDDVNAGGRAALIKVATDEWTIEGALTD